MNETTPAGRRARPGYRHFSPTFVRAVLFAWPLVAAAGCGRAAGGPDKTVAGGLLGAAWGAGAGSVVGHQVGNRPEGTAIGAGFGLVNGAAQGAGIDVAEDVLASQDDAIESLRVQNDVNGHELELIQQRLDFGGADVPPAVTHVYFDPDATNLRAGSIAELEALADAAKGGGVPRRVVVTGHTDDSGTPDYNARVAEARARTVMSYLAARGLASDQIIVRSYGSTRPVTSNATAEGRQLNRRVEVLIAP